MTKKPMSENKHPYYKLNHQYYIIAEGNADAFYATGTIKVGDVHYFSTLKNADTQHILYSAPFIATEEGWLYVNCDHDPYDPLLLVEVEAIKDGDKEIEEVNDERDMGEPGHMDILKQFTDWMGNIHSVFRNIEKVFKETDGDAREFKLVRGLYNEACNSVYSAKRIVKFYTTNNEYVNRHTDKATVLIRRLEAIEDYLAGIYAEVILTTVNGDFVE